MTIEFVQFLVRAVVGGLIGGAIGAVILGGCYAMADFVDWLRNPQ